MFDWIMQISMSVHKVMEVAIVVKQSAPTLQAASHVSVNLDSQEMDAIAKVSHVSLTSKVLQSKYMTRYFIYTLYFEL